MADNIAGGPLGLEPEPLPEGETEQGAASLGAEDQKQPQATETKSYTETQIKEMIEGAVSEATKGLVSQDDVERQVSNVRSSLMKSQNNERSEWEQRDSLYRDQIHQLTVKDMDEDTRARFERDLYAQRSQELEDRLYAAEGDLENARQIGPYLKNLVKGFGIDIGELDLTNIDTISDSAYEAAAKAYTSIVEENKELKQKLTGDSPADDKPAAHQRENVGPDAENVVIDASGETTSAAPTVYDLRKSISQRMGLDYVISEEQLFEMGERPEETGVDLNVVLQALEAEEASE